MEYKIFSAPAGPPPPPPWVRNLNADSPLGVRLGRSGGPNQVVRTNGVAVNKTGDQSRPDSLSSSEHRTIKDQITDRVGSVLAIPGGES